MMCCVPSIQHSAVLHADGWHDMHVHARISGLLGRRTREFL